MEWFADVLVCKVEQVVQPGPRRQEVIKAQPRSGIGCHDEDLDRDNCTGANKIHYLPYLKSPQLQSRQACVLTLSVPGPLSSFSVNRLFVPVLSFPPISGVVFFRCGR